MSQNLEISGTSSPRNLFQHQSIQQDAINFSVSKQKYSFGKQDRFPSVRKPNTATLCYETRAKMSKRATGFGYGERFKITQKEREKNNSPPPGQYTLRSDFDIGKPGSTTNVTKNHIYGFGLSHKAYNKVYRPHQITKETSDTPGPGQYVPELYNIGKYSHFHTRNMSLHRKVKNIAEPLHINTKQNIPGPGTYGQTIEINKTGKYFISTIENSKAAAWSPSKKRFNDDNRYNRNLPAPNHYHPSDKSDGHYLLSNFKTDGVRIYKPKTKRSTNNSQNNTPGPGSYVAQSDFGQLFNMKNSVGSVPQTAQSSRRSRLRSRNGAATTAQTSRFKPVKYMTRRNSQHPNNQAENQAESPAYDQSFQQSFSKTQKQEALQQMTPQESNKFSEEEFDR